MEPSIEVGDRFEDQDYRNAGRVVEVKEILPDGRYYVQTEAHPKNPSAVGKHSTVNVWTLTDRHRYRKISR